jgi:flagellar hook-associated protein 3 FlgL
MRVQKPSDDPAAWLAAQRADVRRTLAAGASTAMQTSRARLDDTDAALASIGESAAQIRTLAVQGANANYNPDDRKELAVQVRALFASALSAANAKAADGEYVLSGSTSLTKPFNDDGTYAGGTDTRNVPTGDVGQSVANLAGSSLTSANGIDVMPLFLRVAEALEANDPTALSGLLDQLDKSVKQIALSRTHVGGAMNVLDQAQVAHEQLKVTLASEISRQVESDTIAAATNLAKASQQLDASRQVTSHVIALVDPTR